MEKLNDTKLTEVLNNFKETPSAEWSNKVEQNLVKFTLNDQKEYTNNSFFIYRLMKNKLIVTSVIAVALLVVGLTAFATYYVGVLNSRKTFTKEETASILAKVLANNSVTTFQESAGLASARSADSSLAASSLTIAPIIDDFNGFNYRYTRTTVDQGPAASRCSDSFFFDKFNGISDSYEYRPNGGSDYKSYLYKAVNYTSANQITNYSLSKYEGNNSLYFEYAGGSYAIKNVYEQGPTTGAGLSTDAVAPEALTGDAVSSDESSVNESDLITQYFGPDAQIVSTTQENGNTYYILRYSYDLLCNGQSTKVVYENKINQTNYSISNTRTYLGSADAANLVSSTSVTSETKNISDVDAAQIFKFDINVPITEVVYPYVPAEEYSADKEASRTIAALKAKSIIALFPQGYQLTYGYAYVESAPVANSNYRADRAFYPSGAIGDEMFKMYNPSDTSNYLSPESAWNFTKDNSYTNSIYIESFKTGTTVNNVMDSRVLNYTDVTNKATTTVQIKVNGVNVNATLFTFTAKQNLVYLREGDAATTSSSEGTSIAPSESRIMSPTDGVDLSEARDYAHIIFEYAGHVYAANKDLYSDSKISAADLDLKAYNANNASDSATLKTELMNAYQKPIPVDQGIGDGSSGSTGSGSTDIACTMEAKQCSDGSYVGRNPKLNCEFDPCP